MLKKKEEQSFFFSSKKEKSNLSYFKNERQKNSQPLHTQNFPIQLNETVCQVFFSRVLTQILIEVTCKCFSSFSCINYIVVTTNGVWESFVQVSAI
jgi:hypothetical protein